MAERSAEACGRDINQAFARLLRAKDTDTKLARKNQAFDDELQRMEQRKIHIATLRKMHHGQRNAWLKTVYKSTIVPYSKSWNQNFAEKMQTRLPPELRNIIYGHLLDFDTWDKYDMDIVNAVRFASRKGWDIPHFLEPEYMGSATAFETAQELFKGPILRESPVLCPTEELHRLMSGDPFSVGIETRSVLRELCVDCKIDRYRRPPNRHLQVKGCQHLPGERYYIDSQKLKSHFKALFDIVRKEGFQLHMNFIQRNLRVDVLAEVMDCFREVYDVFREADARPSTMWSYRANVAANHMHEPLDYLFDIPHASWRAKLLKRVNLVHPVGAFLPRHRRFIREPKQGLSDTSFVHKMWDDSENELTTSEEEDSADEALESGSDSGEDAIYWADGTRYV